MSISRRRFLCQSAAAATFFPIPQFASLGMAAGGEVATDASPKRFVVFHNPLSFYNPAFYPEKAGLDFEAPRLLKPLEPFRGNYTVFNGLDHPNVEGGHSLTSTLLTGINYEHRPNKRHTISLDQVIADKVGSETRFDKLIVGGSPISYDVNGTPCPKHHHLRTRLLPPFVCY